MEEEIKIVVLGKDIPVKFPNFSFKDIVVTLNIIIQSDLEMTRKPNFGQNFKINYEAQRIDSVHFIFCCG